MNSTINLCITLGNGCNTIDHFLYCIDEGISKYRLNLSNGLMLEKALTIMDNFHSALSKRNAVAEIIADVDYPRAKVRARTYKGAEYPISKGDNLMLQGKACKSPNEMQTSIEILNGAHIGDILVIGDGELLLQVTAITESTVMAEAMNEWFISDGRGVTILGKSILSDNLSVSFHGQNKQHVIDSTSTHAISFVECANDVSTWKNHYGKAKVWSKIESCKGLQNISEIVSVSDAVIIARGDLVLQMPPSYLHQAEQIIIKEANSQHKPVYLATEVLSSLISKNFPTRAEISGLMGFLNDAQIPGILLTKESSFGFDVLQRSLNTLKNILKIQWQ